MKQSLVKPRRGPARPKFDSLEQEAYLGLWRTYDRLKALEEELFGRYDLSAQQYNALRLLRSALPGTMATLSLGARLVSRAPDITRLLDKLEQRGLIERQRRNSNRRVVEIGITGEGLALLDELAQQVQDCHHRQLGHLSDRSLRDLIKLLETARQPHEEPTSWPATAETKATRNQGDQ